MRLPAFARIAFARIALALVAAIAVAIQVSPPAAAQGAPPSFGERFERDRLTVETTAGARHGFEVELAVTDAQQRQGLMFRQSLAPNAGMLFLYAEPLVASFWMRNTLIPLDMIFIAADGRIVNIHANAKPLDDTPISAAGPVIGVLEIAGGRAAELGIRAGDRVVHKAFSAPPAK